MSTITNTEATLATDAAVKAMVNSADMLSAFAIEVQSEPVEPGTQLIVEVDDITNDAAQWDAVSNNYGTVNADGTVGIKVNLNGHLKKTFSLHETKNTAARVERKATTTAKSLLNTLYGELYNEVNSTNFPDNARTIEVAEMDGAKVVELETYADDAAFGDRRSLVLANEYTATLKTDHDLVTLQNTNDDPSAIRSKFEELSGFDVVKSTVIKTSDPYTGADKLRGFISNGTGLAVALGLPTPPVEQDQVQSVSSVDDKTGIAIQMRWFYEKDTAEWKYTMELYWGVKLANAKGIQRIISAV